MINPIWQIECEFAKFDDGRIKEIFIDFSKLVLGSAPNKLFIGSLPKNENKENYKGMVLDIARACQASHMGKVYFALVPHPDNWKSGTFNKDQVELWELTESWTSTVG